jgi:hypothetical protein
MIESTIRPRLKDIMTEARDAMKRGMHTTAELLRKTANVLSPPPIELIAARQAVQEVVDASPAKRFIHALSRLDGDRNAREAMVDLMQLALPNMDVHVTELTVGKGAGAGHTSQALDLFTYLLHFGFQDRSGNVLHNASPAQDERTSGLSTDMWIINPDEEGDKGMKFGFWLFRAMQNNKVLEAIGRSVLYGFNSDRVMGWLDRQLENKSMGSISEATYREKLAYYKGMPKDKLIILETTHSIAAQIAIRLANDLKTEGWNNVFVVEHVLDHAFLNGSMPLLRLMTCSTTTIAKDHHWIVVPDMASVRSYTHVFPEREDYVFPIGAPANVAAVNGYEKLTRPDGKNLGREFEQRDNHVAILFGGHPRREFIDNVKRFLTAEQERIKSGEIILTFHFLTQQETALEISSFLKKLNLYAHVVQVSDGTEKIDYNTGFGTDNKACIRLYSNEKFPDAVLFRWLLLGGRIKGGKPRWVIAAASEFVNQVYDETIICAAHAAIHEKVNLRAAIRYVIDLIHINPKDWLTVMKEHSNDSLLSGRPGLGNEAIALLIALLSDNKDVRSQAGIIINYLARLKRA